MAVVGGDCDCVSSDNPIGAAELTLVQGMVDQRSQPSLLHVHARQELAALRLTTMAAAPASCLL